MTLARVEATSVKAFQPEDSPVNSSRRTYDGRGVVKAHEQHRAKSAHAAVWPSTSMRPFS
jgi:hypothetical protein